MTFKPVFIMFVILAFFSFYGALGDSSLGDVATVDKILGFHVDEVAQGAGFLGVPRVSVQFMTTTLPRFVTFNYSFMNDPSIQFVRVILATIFGGTLVILFSIAGMGILRRLL